MKKNGSLIASIIIIIIALLFGSFTIVSATTPDLAKEIKKDISKGIDGLCNADITTYYNIYNTRKLTEIEKTKFYDKISSVKEVIESEKELFLKYKLNIQIKDVVVIDKIGDNLYLCNLTVNYKCRKNPEKTDTMNVTEDYMVKIIDVGNMDYKILLPFNSLDKDFSSGNIFKYLEETMNKKQAEKVKEQREQEEQEKLDKLKEESEEMDEDGVVQIIEDSSDIDEEFEDEYYSTKPETSDSEDNIDEEELEKPDVESMSYSDFVNN
jgi:hypothetical protein